MKRDKRMRREARGAVRHILSKCMEIRESEEEPDEILNEDER